MERVKILLSIRNIYVFNNFLPISPISAFCWGRHARIYWLFHHTIHNTCGGVLAAVVAHHRKHHINYCTTANADAHKHIVVSMILCAHAETMTTTSTCRNQKHLNKNPHFLRVLRGQCAVAYARVFDVKYKMLSLAPYAAYVRVYMSVQRPPVVRMALCRYAVDNTNRPVGPQKNEHIWQPAIKIPRYCCCCGCGNGWR